MTPTIEERLARYAAQLDDAARAHVPAAARGRAVHGPGRRVLLAALGVAVAAAIALGIAVANHGGHPPQIGPGSTPTSAVTTTPPTHGVATTTTTTASTTSLPVGTRQTAYQPFAGNGIDPRLHVTAQVSGSCFHTRLGTHDYYRCFAASGGTIYDPCFAGPHGTAVPLVCPRDPVSVDVVELRATSVTDNSPIATARPWAMQLAGGQVCQFVSAAWGALGPYSCAASVAPPHVADCREPTGAEPWWSAACQERLSDASPFAAQRVVTVWY